MATMPYGPSIHEAVAEGDLERMRSMQKVAEKHLKEVGNVPLALEILKSEIAKLEHRGRES
jgi:hypothetical protein